MRFVLPCEDLSGRKQAVECGREAGIDSHLHDDFNDLLIGATDVPRALNMHLELGSGVAERCERRHHGEFPSLQIEAWPRIDVAKGKFNEQPRKVGRDVAQTFNNLFARLTIDFFELFPTPQIAFVVHLISYVFDDEGTLGLLLEGIQYPFCDTFSI